jgi:hypothetical protein
MPVPAPPAITALPPAPNVEAGKAAFNAAANIFVPALSPFGVEMNALADWVEDRANAIETQANAAEADAAAAEAAQAAAEEAQEQAEIAAAAAGAAAGLPSLTGNAGKALIVNADADGVAWGEVVARGGLRLTYGGTADAITLTSGLGISGTVPTGLQVRFRATAPNTGATTIALDGGTPIACRTVTGVALPAGYVRDDATTEAEFDGTNWVLRRQPEYKENSDGTFRKTEDGWMTVTKTITGLGPISTADGSNFISGSVTIGNLAAVFAEVPARQLAAANPSAFGSIPFGVSPPTVSAGGTARLQRSSSSSNTEYVLIASFEGPWY